MLKTTIMRNTIFYPGIFITILGLQNCGVSPVTKPALNDQASSVTTYHIALNEETDPVTFLLYKQNEEIVSSSLPQTISYRFIETNMQEAKSDGPKGQIGSAKNMSAEVFSYQGTYSFGNKKFIGMVDFKGIQQNGNLDFIISIGSSKGCTSSLKGSAKFAKPGLATYRDSSSGCSLSFLFTDKNKLEVKENNCHLFHGATCQFHGTFKKE